MRKDLTGKKIGRLLVLSYAYTKNSVAFWKCLCDCGNEKIIASDKLNRGLTNSCGCLAKEKSSIRNRKDLTGQIFGRLKVTSDSGDRNSSGTIKWNCKCDCGNEHIATTRDLVRGSVTSCGCYQKECASIRLKGRTGCLSYTWNPNITQEERENGRFIPEYDEWRSSVYSRDSYTCQKCGSTKSNTLNAHHIESYNNNPDKRTLVSNGVTLCKKCHKNFHHMFGYGDNTKQQFEEFMHDFPIK